MDGCQVQSPHYRKSECREDIHFTKGLRYDRESGDLQARPRGRSVSGMFSFLMRLSISLSSQVQLDPTTEV